VIVQVKWKGFLTDISLYFGNDTYMASCNGRRIGTRMRYIEWYHFQWPWVARRPNPHFKVTPIFDAE